MTPTKPDSGQYWRRNLYNLFSKKNRIKNPKSPEGGSGKPKGIKKHIRKLSLQFSSPKRALRTSSDAAKNIPDIQVAQKHFMHLQRSSTMTSPSLVPHISKSPPKSRTFSRRSKSLFKELPHSRDKPLHPSILVPPPRTARSSSAASYFGRKWRRRRSSALVEDSVRIRDGSQEVHREIHLSEVLECPGKRDYFEDFLKRELSDENLKFLVACDAYSETIDRLIEENSHSKLEARNMVIGLANELADKFLSLHAATPVNLSWQARFPIQRTLNAWSMYLRLERVHHLEQQCSDEPYKFREVLEKERDLCLWDLIDQQFIDPSGIQNNRPEHRRSSSEPTKHKRATSTDISAPLPDAVKAAMQTDLDTELSENESDDLFSFWDLVDAMNSETEEAKHEVKPDNDHGESFLLPGGFSWIEYNEKVHHVLNGSLKYRRDQTQANENPQQVVEEMERRANEERLLQKMLRKEQLRLQREAEEIHNACKQEDNDDEVEYREVEGGGVWDNDDEDDEPVCEQETLSWRLYGLFDTAYREVYQLLNQDCFKRFVNHMQQMHI